MRQGCFHSRPRGPGCSATLCSLPRSSVRSPLSRASSVVDTASDWAVAWPAAMTCAPVLHTLPAPNAALRNAARLPQHRPPRLLPFLFLDERLGVVGAIFGLADL